jgi:hypothetical protein
MSGRHGPEGGGPDDPQVAIEKQATRYANLIAGLGWRLLKRPEILTHPKVLSALRNLAELLQDPDESPGRHRSTADGAISQQISDAFGDDLKPNPLTATTPTEFIDVVMEYRAWSGDPSWRTIAMIARQSGNTVVYSTLWNAMNGPALPKLEIVKAIVIGCGGGEDDLRSFVLAWRRIALARARDSFRPVGRRS